MMRKPLLETHLQGQFRNEKPRNSGEPSAETKPNTTNLHLRRVHIYITGVYDLFTCFLQSVALNFHIEGNHSFE